MITVGLDANRSLTKAFIDVAPVEISLSPRAGTPDGTGGKIKTTGTPRSTQTFSLLEPGGSGFQEPVATADGKDYTVAFILLGLYDAVVELDDVFTVDGHDYKIVAIMPDNGYEKRAVVIKHGW